jgi:uncharacterized YceG family protein
VERAEPVAPPVDHEAAPVEREAASVAREPEPVEREAAPVEPEAAPVEPEAAPVEPEAAPVEPEAVPVEPEAAPVEPPPAPRADSPGFAAPPVVRRARDPQPDPEDETASEPVPTLASVRDRPLPPRRSPAERRPLPQRPRRPLPPPRARTRRPGSWPRRVGAIVALLVLVVAVYLINATFQPFHGDGTGSVAITVPAGANVGRIGSLLESRGVIDSATFFQLNATLTGRRGSLHPGHYTLVHGMSNGEAISALTKGPKAKPPAKTVDVTFSEGPSIGEMAPVVDRSHKVKGSYLKATRRRSVRRAIRKLGAPRGTRTAEGFLFPATYPMVVGSTAAQLVDKQLQAFRENFAKVSLSYAKRHNLTRYDVLTIASMVEREAQLDRERPLIAAVMYNRLKAGMPLGIDATIRYETHNWARPIRQSELDADTPYNTRKRQGLPPTPIGNPGLKSLEAAAHPARVGYLFYVVKPGKCGEHAFSSTDAQFMRDLNRYNSARDKAGGKSPTSC